MDKEHVFLDPQITLKKVAVRLNTNTAYLSKLINENYNSNFSRFINTYRIKEAQNMINNKEQMLYTFEGIAKSVGFNSKSAFNSAFKNIVGLTPTQYSSSLNTNNTL